jgi:hypothetical protein
VRLRAINRTLLPHPSEEDDKEDGSDRDEKEEQ